MKKIKIFIIIICMIVLVGCKGKKEWEDTFEVDEFRIEDHFLVTNIKNISNMDCIVHLDLKFTGGSTDGGDAYEFLLKANEKQEFRRYSWLLDSNSKIEIKNMTCEGTIKIDETIGKSISKEELRGAYFNIHALHNSMKINFKDYKEESISFTPRDEQTSPKIMISGKTLNDSISIEEVYNTDNQKLESIKYTIEGEFPLDFENSIITNIGIIDAEYFGGKLESTYKDDVKNVLNNNSGAVSNFFIEKNVTDNKTTIIIRITK